MNSAVPCTICGMPGLHNCYITGRSYTSNREPLSALPETTRDDLMQGTKYAVLRARPAGVPEFAGVGFGIAYGTEAYAVCGQPPLTGAVHPGSAPSEWCQCGFWVPTHPLSRLSVWERGWVALEVEFGGKVLECSPDGYTVYGYRAQWQRVLSVTLHETCSLPSTGCDRPGTALASVVGSVSSAAVSLVPVCDIHAFHPDTYPVSDPVRWLRAQLRTEVRPSNVTGVAPLLPVPLPPARPVIAGTRDQHGPTGSTAKWTLVPGQEGDGIAEAAAVDMVPGIPTRNSGGEGDQTAGAGAVVWRVRQRERGCLVVGRTETIRASRPYEVIPRYTSGYYGGSLASLYNNVTWTWGTGP